MPPSAELTAAEIARLAGVTRATVSNWRRRHTDFPAPVGGTDTSPTYDLAQVRAWLAARGQLPTPSAADDLRVALRAHGVDGGTLSRLLALLLAVDRLAETARRELVDLPDNRLPARARELARPYADRVPGTGDAAYRSDEVPLLRALARCVQEKGALAAADVLAETDADSAGIPGRYETPAPLAELMADLLTAAAGNYPARVLDPACGRGGLLAAAAARGAKELYGQDLSLPQAAQAAVRLAVLAKHAQVRVGTGDSLRKDAFPALTAEAALCAPPYGNRDWGHEELAYDPRWLYGLPPRGEPELAWAQHCLAHVTEGSPVVLLLPPATAERASGRRIRGELVRRGVLRAVVALPPGAAAPLHVGLHIWVLQRPHARAATAPTVLFVDTLADHQTGGRPGRLDWAALRRTVLDTWRAYAAEDFADIPGTARAVPAIDLLDGTVDLTPSRHVHTASPAVRPDQHADTARQLRARLRAAADELARLVDRDGWVPAGDEARTWQSVTVADLVSGGALTLFRSPASGRGSSPVRSASHGADGTGQVVEIRPGDVLLPELLQGRARVARVADVDDVGYTLGPNLYLLRPDPQRLDPWFLAGFLSDETNVNAATTGTSIVRLDARRLRVPLLPLAEQQRYGIAFRYLGELRAAADLVGRLTAETVRALATGLTGGALLPPDEYH
ncbi:MAG TPA: N-6 DNA methylase [Micromonosporaceae bacterium]